MLTIDNLASSDFEDKTQLLALAEEARAYLEAQPWCERIDALLFGDGFERVAVFRAYVSPGFGGEDEFWVVVGDLPPMHLGTNGGAVTTPAEALVVYVGKLVGWFYAAKEGSSGRDAPTLLRRHSLEPADVTPDLIGLIDSRISLLSGAVIPWILGEPGTLPKRRPQAAENNRPGRP